MHATAAASLYTVSTPTFSHLRSPGSLNSQVLPSAFLNQYGKNKVRILRRRHSCLLAVGAWKWGMKLNWNGRAPQAAQIPDAEWEKHKDVIVLLRPLMTLEALMVTMARDYSFTASRPQYKSRFQKWELPNVKAAPSLHGIGTTPAATTRDPSFNLPLREGTSNLQVEAVAESLLSPTAESTPSPAVEHETPLRAHIPSVANSEAEMENVDNKRRPVPLFQPGGSTSVQPVTPNPSRPLQSNLYPGSIEVIAPRDLIDAMERYDVEPMLSAQDLQNIAEAGHFLFAAGSYQNAYDLYTKYFHVLLARNHETMHPLVSAVVNVARSAQSLTQLEVAKQAIEKLMQEANEKLKLFPTAEFTLRAQLADILRKLGQPIEAAKQCAFVLTGSYGWGCDSGYVPNDRRGPAFLLYQCCIKLSERSEESTDHSCLCSFQPMLPGGYLCWRTKSPNDENLRLIFTWCAARLLDTELHQPLPALEARHVDDDEAFFRELATVVFCHLWMAFLKASKAEEEDENIAKLVFQIRELMGISTPEIFATASVALMSLAPRWVVNGVSSRSIEVPWQCYHTAQNLRCVQERALWESSHPEFIEIFLTAYATVNTSKVPSQILEADHVSAFVQEHSNISLSFSLSQASAATSSIPTRSLNGPCYSLFPKASIDSTTKSSTIPTRPINGPSYSPFPTGSFDPTISITPRSSQSSGFASMLSLQRRIARGQGHKSNADDLSIRSQRRDSASTSSLRRQLGLSITSYRTLSTDDSESLHSSAMDWEPTIGTIEEGIAI
ncbi:hypothetical protein EPUS_03883 [Endocarpon pusillum Z07020]|uniref:Clr5 domain-containing protein n=1 Tax=Endocarpon pusillum (strain Z07020 / HMAS-L-300199) TaxID=1263415 RepID=U1HUV5_ENDPU|nr:uncharacterized protein EPUS_03883 [Endocarpon pusillum Z07020]ERF74445.1 hypothetical protein EPUS_03883 [Endocarpon pusillum Z07020]